MRWKWNNVWGNFKSPFYDFYSKLMLKLLTTIKEKKLKPLYLQIEKTLL